MYYILKLMTAASLFTVIVPEVFYRHAHTRDLQQAKKRETEESCLALFNSFPTKQQTVGFKQTELRAYTTQLKDCRLILDSSLSKQSEQAELPLPFSTSRFFKKTL